jgi:hypothetical protein
MTISAPLSRCEALSQFNRTFVAHFATATSFSPVVPCRFVALSQTKILIAGLSHLTAQRRTKR